MLQTFRVSIEPESAVCLCMMFNNHYNNFLTDTPQIGQEKEEFPNPMRLS